MAFVPPPQQSRGAGTNIPAGPGMQPRCPWLCTPCTRQCSGDGKALLVPQSPAPGHGGSCPASTRWGRPMVGRCQGLGFLQPTHSPSPKGPRAMRIQMSTSAHWGQGEALQPGPVSLLVPLFPRLNPHCWLSPGCPLVIAGWVLLGTTSWASGALPCLGWGILFPLSATMPFLHPALHLQVLGRGTLPGLAWGFSTSLSHCCREPSERAVALPL